MKSYDSLLNCAISWRDFFIDLIFPIECLSCGGAGEWLCLACFHKIKINAKQFCIVCGKKKELGRICRSCSSGWSLDGLWMAGCYDDELMGRLVKFLKYYFVKDLSEVLGKFLSLFVRDLVNRNNFWQERPLKILQNLNEVLVIPIPLHLKRERFRGFNQANLIAEKLSRNLKIEINAVDLVRTKHTKAQAKLKKEDRLKNIIGSFAWQGSSLNKRKIILLDDVATSGATLNEAAKVLKEAGAGEVWGLVVARG